MYLEEGGNDLTEKCADGVVAAGVDAVADGEQDERHVAREGRERRDVLARAGGERHRTRLDKRRLRRRGRRGCGGGGGHERASVLYARDALRVRNPRHGARRRLLLSILPLLMLLLERTLSGRLR